MKDLKKYKEAIIFPVLDVLLNGGNLLLHLYIGYFLLSSDYGRLQALLSWLSLLMIIGIATQTITAKSIASKSLSMDSYRQSVSFLRTIVIGCSILIAPVMVYILRSSYLEYVLLLIAIFYQIKVSYYRGVLQGREMFLKLNKNFYFEMLVKLTLTVLLLQIIPIVSSALVAIVISLMVASYGRHREKLTIFVARGGREIELLKYLASQFFFYYLTAFSVIIINFYRVKDVGIYAISGKLSQIFVFISLSLITVFIPHVAKVDKRKLRKMMYRLMMWSFLVLLLLWLAFIGSSQWILPRLMPLSLMGAISLMPMHGLAYVFLGYSLMVGSLLLISEHPALLRLLSFATLLMTIVFILVSQNKSIPLTSYILVELICYGGLAALLVVSSTLRRKV